MESADAVGSCFRRFAVEKMNRSKDPHRNRPATWNHRHGAILARHLAGRRTCEIASELGYAAGRVSTIINSPLFKEHKVRLLRELQGTGADDLLESIRCEALPNLEFLIAMRDEPALHGGNPRVRLRAAKIIAEMVERASVDSADAEQCAENRIGIGASELDRMQRAVDEAGGRREIIPCAASGSSTSMAPGRSISLDDFD